MQSAGAMHLLYNRNERPVMAVANNEVYPQTAAGDLHLF